MFVCWQQKHHLTGQTDRHFVVCTSVVVVVIAVVALLCWQFFAEFAIGFQCSQELEGSARFRWLRGWRTIRPTDINGPACRARADCSCCSFCSCRTHDQWAILSAGCRVACNTIGSGCHWIVWQASLINQLIWLRLRAALLMCSRIERFSFARQRTLSLSLLERGKADGSLAHPPTLPYIYTRVGLVSRCFPPAALVECGAFPRAASQLCPA